MHTLFDGPEVLASDAARTVIERAKAHPVAPGFDEFWQLWPKREAKKDARRAWDKLSAVNKTAALAALPAHVARWRNEGRARNHIPHPATWLNGERWEDELGELFPAAARREAGPAWWASEALTDEMARRVGAYPARNGESWAQYRDRIRTTINVAGAG